MSLRLKTLKGRRGLLLANLNRIPQRYYSQLVLDDFSYEDQKILCESEVTIIGCGGLGSPLAVYLVAAGVGKINLIDFDAVEERNLHRQVFYKESDIGRKKVEALKDYLINLDKEVEVNIYPVKSSEINFKKINSNLFFDCTDNLKTSFELNQEMVNLNKPICFASASEFNGQIIIFKNSKKEHCCYSCLFKESGDLETNHCVSLGVLGPAVAVIASMQSLIGMRFICGKFEETETLIRVDSSKFEIKKNRVFSDKSCRLNRL